MTTLVQLNEITKSLRERVKTWTAQGKAMKALQEALEKGDVASASRAMKVIDGEAIDKLGLGDWALAALEAAKKSIKELRQDQKVAFAQNLKAEADAAGRSYRRLGEQPPEYLLRPFTVQLDPKNFEAVLLFAREELGRSPAQADAVLKQAAVAEKELSIRQLPAEEHFDVLFLAYRAVLGTRGLAMGERVELVDVLPQVALQYQARGFREDPTKGRFFSYTKARFLYDLSRLRDARCLTKGSLRLDLGTATGDSVKKKGRVFFVPTPDGGGQYYLSLRFIGAR